MTVNGDKTLGAAMSMIADVPLEFIPVEQICAALRISPRQLKTLAERSGFKIYSFGQRSRRMTVADYRALVSAAEEHRERAP